MARVKHAASVRSGPGSNSNLHPEQSPAEDNAQPGPSFDRAAKRSNNLTCPRAQQHHRAAARASLPSSHNANQQNPEAADKNAIAANSGRCQVLAGTGSPRPREGRANG